MERLGRYFMSIELSIDDMQELESTLVSFLESLNITLVAPVDVFELADKLGFDIRGAEFEEHLEGMIIVNEFEEKIEGFESNKVIAYNCKKSIENKKFIVAHELAHYIWEKSIAQDNKIVVAARDHCETYSDDIQEQKMDFIAACILLPKDHLVDSGLCNPSEIAEHFNTSLDLATRRLQEVSRCG